MGIGGFRVCQRSVGVEAIGEAIKGEEAFGVGESRRDEGEALGDGEWESVEKIGMVDGVVLCHDALGWTIKNGWSEGWPRMFCGHVHGNWKVTWGRYVNVGVDQWGYRPVEWGEAAKLFKD